MKYWLLTTEYPPFFGGGISTYCYHTAVMLSDRGHDVSVFINDASVDKVKIQFNHNIRIVRFNPSQTNSSSFLGHHTNISYEFANIVRQFIEKEGRPDIIEAQEYLGIAYYLLQYKYLLYDWCADIPVLITMHSPSFLNMVYNNVSEYRYPNYWVCEMELFCLGVADHVISPSKYIIAELEYRAGLSQERTTVIPNPYEFSSVEEGEEQHKRADQIIFYGKLTAQKGVFELLRYFKKLWDNGFSRPLYLIGGQDIVYHPDGITMGALLKKKYAKYITANLLFFEDKIKPSQVSDRLSVAEVIIVPSNNDNFPYVVLEMMAFGKIVLASRQGGHLEIVEQDQNGFLFDHKLPDTFTEQLQKILSLTPLQRKIISRNAVETIKRVCGYEAIYSQKSVVLEQLLKEQRIKPVCFPFVNRKTVDRNVSLQEIENGNSVLSVVIPYYNLGKYLGDTINAIRQTLYEHVEIIIVNDGSSERKSIVELDAYRSEAGIRVIDIENSGLAAARNIGALYARGEYLAFLDADDTISPEYYSRAISVLRKYNNVHFVGCWSLYFEKGSGSWPAFTPQPPLLLFHNLVNSSALVYKRQSFLKAGKNDENMPFQGVEDYDSVISMVEQGCYGVVIPELLFHYRIRKKSMFRQISKSQKIILSHYMVNKHKKLYADFATEIVNLNTANGPGVWIDNPSLDLHLTDNLPFGAKVSLKFIRVIKKNKFVRTVAYKLYSYLKK